MKHLMTSLAIIIAVTTSVLADDAQLTSKEKRARRKARMEARIASEGGIISKPNTGNFARIVNCQKKVSTEFIKEVAAQFNSGLNIYIEVSDLDASAANPFDLVEKALALPRTGLVTMIVDDEKLPPILSAMENGWAILNIKHLRDDLPPKAVYELRLRKEINRAFAQAAGAGLSFNKPCVMEPVYKITDLDAVTYPVISPETMNKIIQACNKRGIQAFVSDTYKNACEQGWAPAPTNDIQKAIWDKVHAVPKNPMKIEFDPKKGR